MSENEAPNDSSERGREQETDGKGESLDIDRWGRGWFRMPPMCLICMTVTSPAILQVMAQEEDVWGKCEELLLSFLYVK